MKINCVMGPFLPFPPIRGGAVERVWYDLCREFAKKGHQVTVISRRYGDLPNNCILDGMTVIRVPSFDAPNSRILFRVYDIFYSLVAMFRLPKADITVTNTVFAPMIYRHRRFGCIYVSVARFPKGQMWLYRRAARLQAVSRSVSDAIVVQTPSVASKVKVIPNCLSREFVNALASTSERQKTVLYTGRIAREKGLDILVRAFSEQGHRWPDWKLILVGPHEEAAGGDGIEFLKYLKQLALRAGDRVEFREPVYDLKALVELYSSSEIFVYPSVAETGESFGLAPLEAMACGCATVVSDLRCFRDFVTENENALIFDHRVDAVNNLSRSISELFDSSQLRRQLSDRARLVADSFSPERVADQFTQDFKYLSGSG